MSANFFSIFSNVMRYKKIYINKSFCEDDEKMLINMIVPTVQFGCLSQGAWIFIMSYWHMSWRVKYDIEQKKI